MKSCGRDFRRSREKKMLMREIFVVFLSRVLMASYVGGSLNVKMTFFCAQIGCDLRMVEGCHRI